MPLRYSLPILGVFAIEHWLLSQATFVVGVVLQDWDIYNTYHTHYTTSGYSIMPCIFGASATRELYRYELSGKAGENILLIVF